jgi:hypothetical protein
MKRPHQRWHLAMWLALAPLVIALVITALVHRPPHPISDPPAATLSGTTP